MAVAPSSAFGELGEGYVRLSLASSREDLLDGASALVDRSPAGRDAQMSVRSTLLALWLTGSSLLSGTQARSRSDGLCGGCSDTFAAPCIIFAHG